MDKKNTVISIAVVAAVVVLIALVSFIAFNPSGSLKRETLIARPAWIADNAGIESTAGRRQAKTIRALLASAGTSSPTGITVDYPFDGAVFPPEFIPPMFMWSDDASGADTWLIDVSLPDGGHISALAPLHPLPPPEIDQLCMDINAPDNPPYPPFQPPATNWTPPAEVWNAIRQATSGGFAEIAVYGFDTGNPSRIVSAGKVSIGISEDPVGAPIFYRDVPMIGVKRNIEDELAGVIQPIPIKAQDIIKWSLRDVSKPASRVLLSDMPTCANCHSFSADGGTFGMDIDGPGGDKGGYAIAKVASRTVIDKDDIISWNYSYRNKFHGMRKTIGFLSQLSPDGKYAVTTLNEQVFVANYRDHKFIQVFYPTRGFLAYYSKNEDDIHLLPGADDPAYVHSDAVWSPDGEYLVFARATARESNIEGRPRPLYANDPNETPIQYDLYRIPFNNGAGGKPVPIEGACANSMSNTFPKVSPDGRWIVFVKCSNGQLMRPDGRLWIVPAEGGEAREMNCNLDLMNSWHTFSPNGRWLAFSSKGMGPYTQLFLTHIDENGNDTPPVLVPNCTAANRAVNIPEFVNVNYDDLQKIDVPAVDFYRHHKKALALGDQGRFKEALEELRLALAENPDDLMIKWELHHRTGLALQQFGDIEGAMEQWKKAIEVSADTSSEPYYLIAIGYAGMGKFAEALEYLEKTVQLAPAHTRAFYYLAKLHIDKNTGSLYNPKKAIEYARRANELTADREPVMLEMLAWTYAADGRYRDAVATMEKALEYARPIGVDEHIRRIEHSIALYKEGKSE